MVETLATERLVLRPLRASDAGPMTLYASDARVARMTTSIPHPYPPGAAEGYIAGAARRQGERVWAIDASPIGAAELVGLIVARDRGGDIGYWVGPPFWNTGYASEALAAVVGHLAGEGRGTITARAFADNPASIHVLEKVGFRRTGTVEVFSVARNAMAPSHVFRHDAGGEQGPAASDGGEA